MRSCSVYSAAMHEFHPNQWQVCSILSNKLYIRYVSNFFFLNINNCIHTIVSFACDFQCSVFHNGWQCGTLSDVILAVEDFQSAWWCYKFEETFKEYYQITFYTYCIRGYFNLLNAIIVIKYRIILYIILYVLGFDEFIRHLFKRLNNRK